MYRPSISFNYICFYAILSIFRTINMNIWFNDIEYHPRICFVKPSSKVDAQIDLTPDAVKWAYLANKKMANGDVYTFRDAQRLGHMKIYGKKSMPMAAFLMRDVFTELGRNEAIIARLKPLLEAL